MKKSQQQPLSGDQGFPRRQPPLLVHGGRHAEKYAHAGRRPSTFGASVYSSYVGRVGALAIALGVGAAIASMPGVAFADTTDSDGSSGSSASSSASSDSRDSSAGAGAGSSPDNVGSSSDSDSAASADIGGVGASDAVEDTDPVEEDFAV